MVKYLGRSETDAGVPETVIADQTLSMYISIKDARRRVLIMVDILETVISQILPDISES